MKTILQIVPRLPPSVCGVGDHAHIIALEMRKSHNINTCFLVADPAWKPDGSHGDFSFQRFESRNASAALDRLSAAAAGCCAIILQYSGYGFSKRGAPFWLLSALKRFRVAVPNVPLVTMFHELYADGPVWRSSFWFSLAQRHVTRSLAALSSRVHTNREPSAQWLALSVSAARRPIVVKQVFSNFGELSDPLPPSQRERRLVIFGHQFDGGSEFWSRLLDIARGLKAKHLTILSRKLQLPPSWPDDISVDSHGILPASEVSAILRRARWGCVLYPAAFLGKSGIFSAMVSHGVVSVLYDEPVDPSEGLQWREHFLSPSTLDVAGDDGCLDGIARNGMAWYRTHDLAATTSAYVSSIEQARSADAST